ncbi:MAG: TRAP transporter permease [Synergistaceae bacterium]|nr:TRAP transporter permease [Synergistaceae bacterium]
MAEDSGKRPDSLIEEVSMDEAEVASLVEKYDVESRFRRLSGWQGVFITVLLASMSLFHLYVGGFMTVLIVAMDYFGFDSTVIVALPLVLQRAIHLTFAIVAVFVLYPASSKGNKKSTHWADWLLAGFSAIIIGYIVLFYKDIARRGAFPDPSFMIFGYSFEIWFGIAAILLVLEAGRRIVGNVLPCLSVLFLLYCYFGEYVPGMFQIRGNSLSRIVQHMYLTTEGIFGVALGVSSTFVIMFIIFGAFLAESGGARFFNELALAMAGGSPGGPAKVAVVAAGLLGTINGSSIANVATTGTFTIPLMKRVGYAPHYAGAVTAAASTGGQLMPPVMGAGAFIMSEFLGIPYLSIAAAAAIPAVLYYTAIFINLHFRARKDGLKGLPLDQLPLLAAVMKHDGHLLIPLIVVIGTLLMRFTPLMAGFTGVVAVLIVSMFRPHTRMGPKKILNALVDGSRGALGVALACALVGFVVGTSSLTSLGLTISGNIVAVSEGNLLATLFMAMIACLILGMGLPTTANYIVCSTIIVPALIKMDIIPIAAHLFVFYFGIMADLTPPVCLAAFTAAGIAGASTAKTGLTATRITIASYILPYVFVYSPMLLLENVAMFDLTILIVSALLGVMALAGGLEGWLFRNLKLWERVILGAVALVAIYHDIQFSIGASVFIVGACVFFKKTAQKQQLIA